MKATAQGKRQRHRSPPSGRPCDRRDCPTSFGPNHYGREEEAAVLRVIGRRSRSGTTGPSCRARSRNSRRSSPPGSGSGMRWGSAPATRPWRWAMAGVGVGPARRVIVPAYMGVDHGAVSGGAIPGLAEIDDSFTLDPPGTWSAPPPHGPGCGLSLAARARLEAAIQAVRRGGTSPRPGISVKECRSPRTGMGPPAGPPPR